jgi:hypothetical protein
MIFSVFHIEQIIIYIEHNGKPGISLLEKEVTEKLQCILWLEMEIEGISMNS